VRGWVGKNGFSLQSFRYPRKPSPTQQKNESPPLLFLKAVSQLQLNRGDRYYFGAELMTSSFFN
jgi:hypothetical protein